MRNYGQYCPIARGSGILAERWTPIIMRNVLLGCGTFNEIAAGAPGLSRALLARRLRELERAGLIEICPKPDGRGSSYLPTSAGRELWPVLQALGDWAEQWMEVTAEQADPDAVLWSWCQTFLRRDLLPRERVVVRFDYRQRGGRKSLWLLVEQGDGELCNFDPGFGDDIVVTIADPLMFARWHLGLVEWSAAVRGGTVKLEGPKELCRALPTWNAYPEVRRRRRTEHQRTPGSSALPPLDAFDGYTAKSLKHHTSRKSTSELIPGFEGQVITATHGDYDRARAVWNAEVDRRPRYIARCLTTSDVVAALRFGRENDLEMSVRGGGHGVAGTAVCDGLVIDLGTMKRVSIDPADRTATVQAGVLWGEFDAAAQAFGLATTGGIVSHTGVSGLTLGGGIGWLMRRHGLAVDNLLQADVVTVDGRQLVANAHEEPDLFWGLRGGGPGLGVVTSFTFRLHAVGPEVLAGPVLWHMSDAPDVLTAYRDFVATAPPEVGSTVVLRRAPAAPYLPVELHHKPVCMINICALGDGAAATRMLAPLRRFGRPLLDLVKHRPYAAFQAMFDTTVPHGWHYYWKAAGLSELDEATIRTIVECARLSHSPRSYTIMFHLGGAVSEADANATAYTRREVAHEINVNAAWLPHQQHLGTLDQAWARSFVDALSPYHCGVYRNFLDRDDHNRLAQAFEGSAYQRLQALRHQYDPDHRLTPHS